MIRIITDSTCDITSEEAKELKIDVIPITILFEEKEYQDGIDLSQEDFYEELKQCKKLPTTSQISPAVFEQYFQKYNSPKDSILVILLSSELSGTLQSAAIAADHLSQNNIYLLDSKNVSIGTAVLIREAVRMRNEGLDIHQILNHCNSLIPRIRTVAVVDTLKYLKMGGRLSASEAMLGSLLHITPIIAVVEGKIQVIAKTRGIKSASTLLSSMLEELPAQLHSSFRYGSASALDHMNQLRSKTAPVESTVSVSIGAIGCAVGTHVGPGAFGYAYVVDEKACVNNLTVNNHNCA